MGSARVRRRFRSKGRSGGAAPRPAPLPHRARKEQPGALPLLAGDAVVVAIKVVLATAPDASVAPPVALSELVQSGAAPSGWGRGPTPQSLEKR
jgi:hypothetical protein